MATIISAKMLASNSTKQQHISDDDSCCIICGFDMAEYSHWLHNTYEGQAAKENNNAIRPECKVLSEAEWQAKYDSINDFYMED